MRTDENTQKVFFELLRAGLWADINDNENANHNLFDGVDWGEVYRLAEEQSVIGLVADGIDRFKFHDPVFKIPQEWTLQFVGQTLQLEQRNRAMNDFIAKLIKKLRKSDVYCILVKGQGVAQCYEKPLWRTCGDVDLLLSSDNYNAAKAIILPLASSVEVENQQASHLGMTLSGWTVELHGTLRSTLNPRMDKVTDEVQNDVFYNGNVRSWENGDTIVFLPSPDNDVFFVFTHILKHFFRGGIGLRQICDWCRLLYKYSDDLNDKLLEERLQKSGILKEWVVLSNFAVEYLGMPVDSVPLYVNKYKYKKMASQLLNIVIKLGNFGHNRDMTYYYNVSYLRRKCISFSRRISDFANQFFLFPKNSSKVLAKSFHDGIISVTRGE